MTIDDNNQPMIELTAEIVAAYVANNPVAATDLPGLIGQVFEALNNVNQPVQIEEIPEPQKPAVPIKKSITNDYLICLEDGQKFKSLKRHLGVHYGLSPEEYRAKWNLPADYPMVAPNYAMKRSALAKAVGLGRKAKEVPAPVVKRTRKKATAA